VITENGIIKLIVIKLAQIDKAPDNFLGSTLEQLTPLIVIIWVNRITLTK
jgi:hypothetical protein